MEMQQVLAQRCPSSPTWVHFKGGTRIQPGQIRAVWQWYQGNTLLLPDKNQRMPLPWCQHNCQRDHAFNQTRNSSNSNQTKPEQNQADQKSTMQNLYIFLLNFPFPVLACHLPRASSGTPSLHSKLNPFNKMQGEIKRISFLLNQAELAGISIRQETYLAQCRVAGAGKLRRRNWEVWWDRITPKDEMLTNR